MDYEQLSDDALLKALGINEEGKLTSLPRWKAELLSDLQKIAELNRKIQSL